MNTQGAPEAGNGARLKTLRRRIAARLIAAGMALCVLFAAAGYYVEHWNVDNFVFELAAAAAQRLRPALSAGTQHALAPEQLDRILSESRLVRVGLLAADGTLLWERWQDGREPARPTSAAVGYDWSAALPLRHDKIRDRNNLYIQTLVPLSGAPQRYMLAVYHVDPITLLAADRRVRDTVVMVAIVVVLTSLALYPFIVGLNAEAVQLSDDLLKANIDLLETLGSAVAKRDSDTSLHNYRVTLYALRLAEELDLPHQEMHGLIAGAFLHDVGKIAIPDVILLKPARHSDDEFEIMKTHVAHGLDIAASSSWLLPARQVIACHHERFDGTGYPQGLAGAQIPVAARVFAIADVFDALTSVRPYKPPIALDRSLAMMAAERGRHFDPAILDRFLAIAPNLYRQVNGADEACLRTCLMSAVGVHLRGAPPNAAAPFEGAR
ncbi:MAG: HD-GYP domain-containing protein [Pseudomonadota bacterium]